MKKLLAAFIAISMLFSGVAFADAETDTSMITIRQEDTSASTGYVWSWSMSAEGILELVSESVTPGSDMLGAPGLAEWTFKAVAPGEVVVSLLQTAPGEGDRDANTVDYTYQVADDMTISLVSTTAPVQVIEFAENPTTGYVWSYEAEGEGSVNEIGNAYYSDSELTGAGGIHLWVFEGLNVGNVTLTFKYARSFEDTEPAKTVVLEYDVDEGNSLNFVSSSEPSVGLSLLENPTTGYEWVLEYADSDIVSLIGNQYVPDANPDGLAGVGGVHNWTFHGLKPGQTSVTFYSVRPWEEDNQPAATVTYAITVADDLSIEITSTDADEAASEMIPVVG